MGTFVLKFTIKINTDGQKIDLIVGRNSERRVTGGASFNSISVVVTKKCSMKDEFSLNGFTKFAEFNKT